MQVNIPDKKTREDSEENWRKVFGDLKKLLEKQTAPKEKAHL